MKNMAIFKSRYIPKSLCSPFITAKAACPFIHCVNCGFTIIDSWHKGSTDLAKDAVMTSKKKGILQIHYVPCICLAMYFGFSASTLSHSINPCECLYVLKRFTCQRNFWNVNTCLLCFLCVVKDRGDYGLTAPPYRRRTRSPSFE